MELWEFSIDIYKKKRKIKKAHMIKEKKHEKLHEEMGEANRSPNSEGKGT